MADHLLLRDNSGIQVSDEIRRRFPAVFNHSLSKRTSENYQLYRSDEMIDLMEERGLKLVELAQQRSTKRSPMHTQHVMRFQAKDAPLAFGINDSVPEVVMMNSHDGKGRFRAYAGVFRFVCDNGMVVASDLLGSTVRRHFGQPNTFEKVKEVVAQLPEAVTAVSNRILDWSGLQLTVAQQEELARLFLTERKAPEWVSPQVALEVHRPEDATQEDGTRSLWHTFNVLQENLTKRQLARPEGATEGRQSPVRPLSGAVIGVDYNRRIWAQADAYFNATVEGMSKDERKELARQRDIYRLRARRHEMKRQAQLQDA